jgi:F-type H+-transporting ATPase subunit epsilon
MRLQIFTPLSVVVQQEIDSLRATDASGSFGILPGHVPFMTALAMCIVSWRHSGEEKFCAVRGGVLTVAVGTTIAIATREAVAGDDLARLDIDVLEWFAAATDAERVEHVEAMRVQMNAIRRMINRLHPGGNRESFR